MTRLPIAAQTAGYDRNQDSRLSRFVSDGQPPKMVSKVLNRVEQVCTDSEFAEYVAVQHLPGVMSPDAIVLTNRRVIIFRSKSLGRMNMVDVAWMDVGDIHISEGVVGASLYVVGTNGHRNEVGHLPKAQARNVYRVGQQREEELRPLLTAAFEDAPEGAVYVVGRYDGDVDANLATTLKRITVSAGRKPWPKTFINLRSTRRTELQERFPSHVVDAWLGHSSKTAETHYLQVTADHYAAGSTERTAKPSPPGDAPQCRAASRAIPADPGQSPNRAKTKKTPAKPGQ